jgi:protein-disulfide isomerase
MRRILRVARGRANIIQGVRCAFTSPVAPSPGDGAHLEASLDRGDVMTRVEAVAPGGVEPLDETVDHVRGPEGAHVILEYGDYECPYSRQAYRAIERVARDLDGELRVAFRHFPLTEIHPHALAAATAAEAAGLQGRFWEMHDVLYRHQRALEDEDLEAYARSLGLDIERFAWERAAPKVLARIARDVASGAGSGVVLGTPTIFVDGTLRRGRHDARTLLGAVRG